MERGELHMVVIGWLCLSLLMATGCARHGSQALQIDRFDYATAVGDSQKELALLNIVKLRYQDWPVFLEVQQILTAYTWENIGVAKAVIRTPFGGDNDQGELGWTGKYSERPNVLYRPLTGQRFVTGMLTPVRPAVLLTLIHSGWPVDRLFETMVHSVNGKKNLNVVYGSGYRADPAFTRFVRVLHRIQVENGLSVQVKHAEKQVVSTQLTFHPDLLSAETRQELDEVRSLLGLSRETNTYSVVWGTLSPDPETIALQTRSVLQVMSTLAWYVDVPPEHLERGIATSFDPIPEDETTDWWPHLMRIHSGPNEPDNAHVAVRYNDTWFWIDNADVNSKRTFAFLSLLLSITEAGEGGGVQVVIPAG